MPSHTRLIPRWYVAVAVCGLAAFTAGMTVAAAAADDVLGRSMWGPAGASLLLLVAAWSSLVRSRRPRAPKRGKDGAVVFRAPLLTVLPLLGAWMLLLLTAACWGYVAATDFGALETPGAVFLTIGGAIGSLPTFARLVTGKLYWWTLELGPHELVYRGYRTSVTAPWSEVRGARIQQRGPAGVRVDLRGVTNDFVLPVAAFDVPAEQLVDQILARA